MMGTAMKVLISVILCIFSFNVVAKTSDTTCDVVLTYDIVVMPNQIRFTEDNTVIDIAKNGQIKHNQHIIPMSLALKSQAKALEMQIRRDLPRFKIQFSARLEQIHLHFEQAIEKRLGNDSRLLNYLDRFYVRLKELMQQTIYEQDNVVYFNHIAFNQLTNRGEKMAKGLLASAIADSLIHFKLIKNYQAVRLIAKDEWKVEKPKLKAFSQRGCAMFQSIDAQYKKIKAQIPTLE